MELPASGVVICLVLGIASFCGWLIRDKFKSIEEIGTRVTMLEGRTQGLEMQMSVLEDIREGVYRLRTDVEVIKVKVENNH